MRLWTQTIVTIQIELLPKKREARKTRRVVNNMMNLNKKNKKNQKRELMIWKTISKALARKTLERRSRQM